MKYIVLLCLVLSVIAVCTAQDVCAPLNGIVSIRINLAGFHLTMNNPSLLYSVEPSWFNYRAAVIWNALVI